MRLLRTSIRESILRPSEIQRNLSHCTVYGILVALFFFGPGNLNRSGLVAGLTSFYDVPEPQSFETTFGLTRTVTLRDASFFLFLLGTSALGVVKWQKPVYRSVFGVLFPSIVLGYFARDIFLCFAGVIKGYLRDSTDLSSVGAERWPYISGVWLLSAVTIWVVAAAVAGLFLLRSSPAQVLHRAGRIFLLTSASGLCLSSGLFGTIDPADFQAYQGSGILAAVYLLPVDMLFAGGLIVLYPMPRKRNLRSGSSIAGYSAESLTSLILLTAVLVFFGVSQSLQSAVRLERLTSLRQAYAEDKVLERCCSSPSFKVRAAAKESAADIIERMKNGMDGRPNIRSEFESSNQVQFLSSNDYGWYGLCRFRVDISEVDPNQLGRVSRQSSGKWEQLVAIDTRQLPRNEPFTVSYLKRMHVDTGSSSNYEMLFQKQETEILQEKSKIPGTELQFVVEQVVWFMGILALILINIVRDRLAHFERVPADIRASYLFWGDTLFVRALDVMWPVGLAVAIFVQMACMARVAVLQVHTTGVETPGGHLARIALLTLMIFLCLPASLGCIESSLRIREFSLNDAGFAQRNRKDP